MEEYKSNRTELGREYLHNWRPPCSCGISLDDVELNVQEEHAPLRHEELHNWRPPCSCGISLDRIDL